jgi:hypothetical protein
MLMMLIEVLKVSPSCLLCTSERLCFSSEQFMDAFQYLVAQESMRLLPAAANGTMRITGQPLRLGDHVIPADVGLCVTFMANFSHPALWNRPDEFLPVSPVPSLTLSHSAISPWLASVCAEMPCSLTYVTPRKPLTEHAAQRRSNLR